MLTLQHVAVASDQQISADLAGEAVILDVEREQYFALDDVGSRIWQLLREPTAVSLICAIIVAEYEVKREQCEGDVLALLYDLRAHGLINVSLPAST